MRLFKNLPRKLLAVVAGFTAAASIATVAIAGFGPDRVTKDWNVDKTGFGYVTYNSFVNMQGKGDERNFLEGVQVGRDASWTDPIANVEAGEIEVKLYMHNNADTSLNDAAGNPGIAKDVTARVVLPNGAAQVKELTAYINASNANPTSIFDTLTISGANGGNFELEPIAGSGKLIENGQVIGTVDVAQLLGDGVKLENQKGCSQYVREITFRLKSKVASWTLDKKVSPYNKGEYAKTIAAKPGDKVDYLLEFQNIGNETLENVVLGDKLPAGINYMPGTTQWLSAHTNWKWQTVQYDNLFNGGIDIAGYQGYSVVNGQRVYAKAYIRFTAQVAAVEQLECGHSVLTNTGYAKPKNYGTIESKADVTVDRTCTEPEKPSYVCTDVKIEKLGGRKIKATVSYNGTPENRVSVKNFEYNYGDGKTALVTDKSSTEYTYEKDGTYKVAVKITFVVDGANQTVNGAACEEVVTFTTTTTPPTTLPNTGAGSLIGMFLATTALGMFVYRGFVARKM